MILEIEPLWVLAALLIPSTLAFGYLTYTAAASRARKSEIQHLREELHNKHSELETAVAALGLKSVNPNRDQAVILDPMKDDKKEGEEPKIEKRELPTATLQHSEPRTSKKVKGK